MKRYGPSLLYILPSIIIGVVVLLLTVAFYLKGKYWGIGFGLFFMIPLFFILLYINFRFIKIEPERICFASLLGKRCLKISEIEKIEVKRLGIRKVLWIQGQEKIVIMPLIFGKLSQLKEDLKRLLGDRLDERGWNRSLADLLLLYLTALFLLTVVASRLILR